MITIQLFGGLGNQLFQYALARRLNIDNKVVVKLDSTWYKTQNEREFELNKLNIKIPILSSSIGKIYNNSYFRKTISILQNNVPYYKKFFINERIEKGFDRNILLIPNHCYLSGYWQSEKYFETIRNELINDFIPHKKYPEIDSQLIDKIHNHVNTVSVHFRKGDYINNLHHYELNFDYYSHAINYLRDSFSDLYFYFFSDDINWVKKNMLFKGNIEYIEKHHDTVSDIFLMSECQHHINANSSFSWWGAWLGEKKDSTIIVPNKWFIKSSLPEDMIPSRWLKI